MRVVPLRGPITETSVYYFISRLLYLAAESPKEPILMEVTSPGGLIPQSLEILRIMDSLPCAVNTFSRGTVGGMATILAAHGARGYRTALSNCRFSLALGEPRDTSPAQKAIQLLLDDGIKDRDQVLNWLATGAEFSAQEALAAGLIDFISTPAPKLNRVLGSRPATPGRPPVIGSSCNPGDRPLAGAPGTRL